MYEVIGRITVWGCIALVAWVALGILCAEIYSRIARKRDGCWAHAIGRTNREALFMGWIVEGGGFLPGIFAAPLIAPWGIYTLHRDGLYSERKKAVA